MVDNKNDTLFNKLFHIKINLNNYLLEHLETNTPLFKLKSNFRTSEWSLKSAFYDFVSIQFQKAKFKKAFKKSDKAIVDTARDFNVKLETLMLKMLNAERSSSEEGQSSTQDIITKKFIKDVKKFHHDIRNKLTKHKIFSEDLKKLATLNHTLEEFIDNWEEKQKVGPSVKVNTKRGYSVKLSKLLRKEASSNGAMIELQELKKSKFKNKRDISKSHESDKLQKTESSDRKSNFNNTISQTESGYSSSPPITPSSPISPSPPISQSPSILPSTSKSPPFGDKFSLSNFLDYSAKIKAGIKVEKNPRYDNLMKLEKKIQVVEEKKPKSVPGESVNTSISLNIIPANVGSVIAYVSVGLLQATGLKYYAEKFGLLQGTIAKSIDEDLQQKK